jgi:hypothetical protein
MVSLASRRACHDLRVSGSVIARARAALPTAAPWLLPTLAAAVDAIVFVAASPPVPDLYAALARESAAAHGVGLTYWFAWFGGAATPGSYSVLSPELSRVVGVQLLGALSTIAITVLTWVALRQAPHPVLATWAATLFGAASLWCGRVPFAAGTALAVAAAAALGYRRTTVAAALAALSALVSPVSGVFLGIGVFVLFVTIPDRRRQCLAVGIVLGATLAGLAAVFGAPGPQPFKVSLAISAVVAAVALLLARPPVALRTAIGLAAVLCLVLFVVPNGLGSNIARLPLFVLPVLALAYAPRFSAHSRTTLPVLALVAAVLPAGYLAVKQSVDDLRSAAQPSASADYYPSLTAALDRLEPELRTCRLEVLDGVTHAGSYLLLGHAMLARGWETQVDHDRNGVVLSDDLDADRYRRWLDDNAVCFVALPADPAVTGSEADLLRGDRPDFLVPAWQDDRWLLLRVEQPEHLVESPVRVVSSSQAELILDVPCACSFAVRVRYSRFLVADATGGNGTVRENASGWSTVTVPRPGRYELRGSLLAGLPGG